MQKPKWVQRAEQAYIPKEITDCTIDYTTGITRGWRERKVIASKLLPADDKLNILEVGTGIYSDPLYCTYEPFVIVSFLEANGVDFSLVIVDRDPIVIDDLRNRTMMYARLTKDLEVETSQPLRRWNQYLAETHQPDRFVESTEPQLGLEDYLNHGPLMCSEDYLFKSGIRAASVPGKWKEKISRGDIRLVLGDIATVKLADGAFDAAFCQNVLYQLPPEGQQLAMFNMASRLKKDGVLLINDFKPIGTPLLPRQGGWFNRKKQADIGLELDDIIDENGCLQAVVFRKIGGR